MDYDKYLFVYILKCADNTYYTGITNDLKRKIEEHNSGTNRKSYTALRRPVKLIYCERFEDPVLAMAWEKRLRNWSRKQKEKMLEENWDQQRIVAECQPEKYPRNK
jgi:putative endonuclease